MARSTRAPSEHPNLPVDVLAIQADGKILIGGSFTEVGGEPRLVAARFLVDGSLDPSFVPPEGGGQAILATTITELADGRILLSGTGGIRRLHSDGTLDQTLEEGADSYLAFVRALAIEPDGRIVVGGDFASLAGTSRVGIGRLLPDGRFDTGFAANTATTTQNDGVFCVVLQKDGKIVLGGTFDTVNSTPRSRLARIEADGSLDSAFVPLGANGIVLALELETDGDVLVGGSFTSIGGVARHGLARIHPNGTIDEDFDPGTDGTVEALAVAPDGDILVGGSFTMLGGETRHNLGRLHPDGALDTTFDPVAGGGVFELAVQPDGKILVSGSFPSMGGEAHDHIARLDPDGSLDTSFDAGLVEPSNARVEAMALQADGKILVGGNFVLLEHTNRWGFARLNPDGSLDTGFDLGFLEGLATPGRILAVTQQGDGKILAGGFFLSIDDVDRDSTARIREPGLPQNRLEVRSDGLEVRWHRDGKGPALERVKRVVGRRSRLERRREHEPGRRERRVVERGRPTARGAGLVQGARLLRRRPELADRGGPRILPPSRQRRRRPARPRRSR